jgi:hypothetical protein
MPKRNHDPIARPFNRRGNRMRGRHGGWIALCKVDCIDERFPMEKLSGPISEDELISAGQLPRRLRDHNFDTCTCEVCFYCRQLVDQQIKRGR